MRSFPMIKFALLVGIGGGVPIEKVDIRLGDVVVSQPGKIDDGVVQYDGRYGSFRRIGMSKSPPRALLMALQSLKAQHLRHGHKLDERITEMLLKYPRMAEDFAYQGLENDPLFEGSYSHSKGDTCDQCDITRIIQRPSWRTDKGPRIHYGKIASANVAIKDSFTRDRIAQAEGVVCFATEKTGLMNSFPSLLIRGVCDYADSHINRR